MAFSLVSLAFSEMEHGRPSVKLIPFHFWEKVLVFWFFSFFKAYEMHQLKGTGCMP